MKKIPYSKVATYGQIAALCDSSRGAQVVGWALRNIDPSDAAPWYRVINCEGRISIINAHVPTELAS